MRDILVLCPQERDLNAIRAAGLEERYSLRFAGSDLDQLEDFDPEAFLAECEGIPADAVVATKDLSALLAAILAERRGLPGPSPQALLRCQHKPASRAVQHEVAPEATPRFALLEANGDPPLPMPFFVKPVVGRLSQNVFRIDDEEALLALHELDRYTARYAEIAALAGGDPASVHGFLAEELLSGLEVTLEGYVHDGAVTTIGITDSVKYPGTLSFERFEYPSALPAERQAELAEVAARVLPALGFDGGFFNVEFFVPEEGPAQIIEVNGRIASQFAPLIRGRARPLDLRRAVRAGPRPGPGVGRGRADVRRHQLLPARLRGRRTSRRCPTPSRTSSCSCALASSSPSRARTTRRATGWRSSPAFGETREEAVERCRERAASLSFRLAPAAGSLTTGGGSVPRASRFEIPIAPTAAPANVSAAASDHPRPEPVDGGLAELGSGLVLGERDRARGVGPARRRRAR